MSTPNNARKDSYLPDSSGIIYSYVNKADWTAAFRFEVALDSEVDKETLNKAIEITRKRFPTFFVQVSPEGKLIPTIQNSKSLTKARTCLPLSHSKTRLITL